MSLLFVLLWLFEFTLCYIVSNCFFTSAFLAVCFLLLTYENVKVCIFIWYCCFYCYLCSVIIRRSFTYPRK